MWMRTAPGPSSRPWRATRAWVASALAGAETEVAIARLPVADDERARQQRRYEEDWEHFRVVPVDAECLRAAARIAAEQGIRIVDAIHLAAARRGCRDRSGS